MAFRLRQTSLTFDSFLTYILPVFACQYSMAVLVQLKGTHAYRGVLLPILLWFAWRVSASVDFSGGDPAEAQLNAFFVSQMCSAAMRATAWATAQEPYQRIDKNCPFKSSQGNQDKADSNSISTALWNAWDLLVNPRGVGWNWPRGLAFPKPAFEIRSRAAFVLLSAVRFAFHVVAFDATLQAIRGLSPAELSSTAGGGSIYDSSLPPVLQLLRYLVISALAVFMPYFGLEWGYHLLAVLFVTLFQQHPSQWPPLFDSPWLSTSLSDLWGRRWHQMFRHMLLTTGGLPFTYLFGRLGGVLGVFIISGLWHDIEVRAIGRGGNSFVLIGFFVMNGVGIVLERVWKRVCGKPVGGVWGWIWTFSWFALWGVPVVNEWAKAGRFGVETFPGGFQPSLALVSYVRRHI
ncbi:hypothetical protein BU15DRAFT_88044 [Melanogaster broomeanus]|nr:hypothetical protein BU15DRAFT_88044 [Melanogaster broomeanus]